MNLLLRGNHVLANKMNCPNASLIKLPIQLLFYNFRLSMKFLIIIVLTALQLFVVNVFAEENHQDNNDCRRKPTKDAQKYCLAIVHKDGSACESISSYELRMHCMHEIADFTRHSFNAYSPMKKSEENKDDKK